MTVEELLAKVNEKTDTTKLKSLSKKTIEEELNDVLDEMGDDEAANDAVITKLANRLKRMDGNLHKNVSDELKKSREEAERKKKEEEDRKRAEQHKNDLDDDKLQKLLAKIEALEKANAERDKKAARNATVESVKTGLKEKFDKAGLEMKNYFLKATLSKLDIPDEEPDIDDLVLKAEKIYTAEYKEATGEKGIPKRGNVSHSGDGDTDDDKFMEAIAKRRKARFGEQDTGGKER